MYVLAKRVENVEDAWTLHGLTDREDVMDAWYAAGHSVFDIDPTEGASFGYYLPMSLPDESEDD